MTMVDLHWLHDRPVLVTGAGGFIGSRVVRRLVALGARVRAWLGPAPAPELRSPPSGVTPVHGDIADPAALARELPGIACVYHLAGPPSPSASFAAPASYLRVHASGTAAVLEACIAARVPRLVYVSSADVYAPLDAQVDTAIQVDEDHPRSPRSPYAIAKLAAEQVLEACAPTGGVQTTIVRPFSIYGPGAPAASLTASVIIAVLRGESPSVADLRPVRDYCYVDDAADGIVRAGCRDGAVVRAYNLASGRGASVAEVVQAVLHAAGRGDLAVRTRGPDRPASALTLRLIGNPARARAELGFEATTALDDGLRRTLHGERPRESGP